MAKKKNPEQETPPAEEQETETPAEETEQPQEETEQEQPAEELEEPAEEEEEETEEPQEDQDNPQDLQEEQQPGNPTQEQPTADESADLRHQLLEARGQIAAYAAGVAPDMVEDAVTLAMAEAAKTGAVTEEAVSKAMDAVLKRHPEWKASGAGKPKGGFRLGADRDNGGSGKSSGSTRKEKKRWNRFK